MFHSISGVSDVCIAIPHLLAKIANGNPIILYAHLAHPLINVLSVEEAIGTMM